MARFTPARRTPGQDRTPERAGRSPEAGRRSPDGARRPHQPAFTVRPFSGPGAGEPRLSSTVSSVDHHLLPPLDMVELWNSGVRPDRLPPVAVRPAPFGGRRRCAHIIEALCQEGCTLVPGAEALQQASPATSFPDPRLDHRARHPGGAGGPGPSARPPRRGGRGRRHLDLARDSRVRRAPPDVPQLDSGGRSGPRWTPDGRCCSPTWPAAWRAVEAGSGPRRRARPRRRRPSASPDGSKALGGHTLAFGAALRRPRRAVSTSVFALATPPAPPSTGCAEADAIARGEVTITGGRSTSATAPAGTPPRPPRPGVRWPTGRGGRSTCGSRLRARTSEWVWELGRHRHLVVLAGR